MAWSPRTLAVAVVLALTACSEITNLSGPNAPPPGGTATLQAVSGTIPAKLPARMLIGLFEMKGEPWMKASGVPWDVRYAYFTYGWQNNWGWGAHDGSYGLEYFQECDAQGQIPAVQYYVMNDEPGGGEAQFLAKAQTAATMREYFSDLKLFFQRAKDFGKPVIVMMEGDGFGELEQQTGGDPNVYAAVADSGVPELAGLPNTVAGWGMAILALRQAAGADNVVIGIHVSDWASGKDIAEFQITDPLQPEVDKVYAFLKPLGLGPNQTGTTYDLLIGDPNDRDADYYRLVVGEDRWWDPSDTAPIDSRSFNRYAEWLRLWNVTSGKRWILWQIPLGNSSHKNVYNGGGAQEGYKDNRPEYFFATGSTDHLEKFAAAGVIALLFGAGQDGQASFQNDVYTDGQPFMKSHAGAFLSAGGLGLPRDPVMR